MRTIFLFLCFCCPLFAATSKNLSPEQSEYLSAAFMYQTRKLDNPKRSGNEYFSDKSSTGIHRSDLGPYDDDTERTRVFIQDINNVLDAHNMKMKEKIEWTLHLSTASTTSTPLIISNRSTPDESEPILQPETSGDGEATRGFSKKPLNPRNIFISLATCVIGIAIGIVAERRRPVAKEDVDNVKSGTEGLVPGGSTLNLAFTNTQRGIPLDFNELEGHGVSQAINTVTKLFGNNGADSKLSNALQSKMQPFVRAATNDENEAICFEFIGALFGLIGLLFVGM